MTKNKLDRARVCLNKKTGGVRTGQWNCKAGAAGRCKHVGGLLFKILDFVEGELHVIPPDTTWTERPQQWHKPRSKASIDSEAPLLRDLLVIKHSYEADKKYNKTEKGHKERLPNKCMKQRHPLQEMLKWVSDHHSESQFKQLRKSQKKGFRSFNGIRTRSLCVSAAVLQCMGLHWPASSVWVFIAQAGRALQR